MTLYVAKNDQQLGPFTLAQAQRMVATGGLLAGDLAWYEGISDWIPLGEVPGFWDAKAPPIRPKEKRPYAIWAISAWYGLNVISTLVLGFLALRLGYLHLDSLFWTLVLGLCLALKIAAIICLLKLKQIAFRIIIVLMILSLFLNAHNLWLWSDSMNAFTAIIVYMGMIVFCCINILIFYFVWHLNREDVLR